MDLELSKMKDLSNHIEELRSKAKRYNVEELKEKKSKIKMAALAHRGENAESLDKVNEAIKEIEKIDEEIKNAETIEKELNEKEKELEEMRNKTSYFDNRSTGGDFKKRNMREEIENKVDIRKAFAKQILGESLRQYGISGRASTDFALTDLEKRALGVATTTTSTEFVLPTEQNDGINNGGLFIPTEIAYELLKDDEDVSSIFSDMKFTAIKGQIKFPYLVQMSQAKKKGELEESEDLSFEWKMIDGRQGNYTATISITYEVEKMTPDGFITYLISLLKEAMREVIGQDLIYGDGEDNSVYGVTHNAIAFTYTEDQKILDVIENGLAKVPKKKRKGAKIYMASDIYYNLITSRDGNDNYKFPILSGEVKPTFAGKIIEEDDLLRDGEFIIGNVSKNYKPNMIANMELTLDNIGTKRLKQYSAHAMISAVPAPSSFVHGKKATTRKS